MIPNRITIDNLLSATVGELAFLPPDQLSLLAEEADARIKAAKRAVEHLAAALDARYREQVKSSLRAEQKDTGTVRFSDGNFLVIADTPKKVVWDQAKLREAFDALSDEEARHYAKVTIEIEEKKFSAAPPAVQKIFEPAREVRPGKTKIRLQRVGCEEAA